MSQSAVELSVLPRLPMSKRLREILAEQLGKPIGLGAIPRVLSDPENPASELVLAKPTYGIVYPLWASTSGTWSHPDADAGWVYQVSLYAVRTDALEWARDRVMAAMLGRGADGQFAVPIVVDGIKVMSRTLVEDAGTDPAATGSVLPMDLRFGLSVTPIRE